MSRLRAVARETVRVLLVAAVATGSAAVMSYAILNDSPLTDPNPAPATPPASRTAAPTPAPSPSPPSGRPAPQGTPSPWPLGSCVTSWQPTAPLDCTWSGALRIVGALHHTGRDEPCADVPEATHVHRAGAYTLCLTAP